MNHKMAYKKREKQFSIEDSDTPCTPGKQDIFQGKTESKDVENTTEEELGKMLPKENNNNRSSCVAVALEENALSSAFSERHHLYSCTVPKLKRRQASGSSVLSLPVFCTT